MDPTAVRVRVLEELVDLVVVASVDDPGRRGGKAAGISVVGFGFSQSDDSGLVVKIDMDPLPIVMLEQLVDVLVPASIDDSWVRGRIAARVPRCRQHPLVTDLGQLVQILVMPRTARLLEQLVDVIVGAAVDDTDLPPSGCIRDGVAGGLGSLSVLGEVGVDPPGSRAQQELMNSAALAAIEDPTGGSGPGAVSVRVASVPDAVLVLVFLLLIGVPRTVIKLVCRSKPGLLIWHVI